MATKYNKIWMITKISEKTDLPSFCVPFVDTVNLEYFESLMGLSYTASSVLYDEFNV